MKKTQLIKIGKELADEYEADVRPSQFREEEEYYYAMQVAEWFREKTIKLAESKDAADGDDTDVDYPASYARSAPLGSRLAWFDEQYKKFENCGFCAELPDDPADVMETPVNIPIPEKIPPVEEKPPPKKLDLSFFLPDRSASPIPAEEPPPLADNNPGLPVDIKKWELIKIGRSLASDFEWEADKYDYKDDRNFWALADAKAVREKVEELSQSINSEALEKYLKNHNEVYRGALPRSAPLNDQFEWFFNECKLIDESGGKCYFCGLLPDDLTVNSGRDERFPDAFYWLEKLGSNNTYDYPFRRCPKCGTCFEWFDMPEMFGTGNNDQERLVRLSTETSRVLDVIFSTPPKTRPDLTGVEKDLKAMPPDVLFRALDVHIYTAPEIIAAFVPRLVELLAQNDPSMRESLFRIRDLLSGYVTYHPERAQAVLDAFWSLDQCLISGVIGLCLTLAGKRK